jgi:hypothetical protein
MKDWRRMCQYMTKMFGDDSCDKCRLTGCVAIYEDNGEIDYTDVENKVDAWAAEHPEPVYPTWGEWLESIEVIKYNERADNINYFIRPTHKTNTQIPADIAQKLGIEPLPVVHCDCGATNGTDARKKLGIEPKED